MSSLTCYQFPYGSDNYGVLVNDASTGETACIDAGDAKAVMDALKKNGWTLTHLLITHHHADHTAGLLDIKKATQCHVTGPVQLSSPIEGLDSEVGDADEFQFANRTVKVIHTPGHTKDMVNFHFPDDKLVFTGDTLFSMGCGRLFEGDAAMMLSSVNKLKQLPDDTLVYCAHEYTATNARFALDVDPDNGEVASRFEEVAQLRNADKATVPVLMQLEKKTNPFLRTDNAQLKASLGMEDADDVAVFAALRKRRDQY